MVDIVNGSIGVDELDEIFDNLDDIFLGKHADIRLGVQAQLLVDTIAAHLAQVVTLVREEQILEYFLGTGIIGRVSITQLAIDVEHGLLLRVRGVFGQSVEDDRILVTGFGILVQENALSSTFQNLRYHLLGDDSLALNDNLRTVDRYYFTSIFVHEVLVPASHHATGNLAAYAGLEVLLVDLYLLGKVEDAQNVLIAFITDGTQQCRNRQFLLTVDISIHYIIYIGRKLNPRTLEWNDTCAVKHSTVGMHTLTEEYTR